MVPYKRPKGKILRSFVRSFFFETSVRAGTSAVQDLWCLSPYWITVQRFLISPYV